MRLCGCLCGRSFPLLPRVPYLEGPGVCQCGPPQRQVERDSRLSNKNFLLPPGEWQGEVHFSIPTKVPRAVSTSAAFPSTYPLFSWVVPSQGTPPPLLGGVVTTEALGCMGAGYFADSSPKQESRGRVHLASDLV
jgi:hypothetical protein